MNTELFPTLLVASIVYVICVVIILKVTNYQLSQKALFYLKIFHFISLPIAILRIYLLIGYKTIYYHEFLNKTAIFYPMLTAVIIAIWGSDKFSFVEKVYFYLFQIFPIGYIVLLFMPYINITSETSKITYPI